MHTHTHLTNVIFVYYANNHFMGLLDDFVHLLGIIGKKKKYPLSFSDVTTSLISGSHLDISKFSVLNNFIIHCPICMKFAPNSYV